MIYKTHLVIVFLLSTAILLDTSISWAQTESKQTPPWNADNSDPIQLGWMQGSPPPADKVIRGTDPDFFSFPKLRWSVCHFQQLMPSVEISTRGRESVALPETLDPAIDNLVFTPLGSNKTMTWHESLDANFTDGIIILKDGTIVYEYYSGSLNQYNKHAAMSVTKSMIGLLAEILVAEGTLDDQQRVDAIVPELKDSGFGNATVRQVMDMTTSFPYSEDYNDPKAEVWTYSASGSPFPKPEGYRGPRTYYEFLQTVKPGGQHGNAFAYKTPNTDVLGWIVAKTTGKSFPDLFAERIWSRMGAEQSAFITIDSTGTPFVGGGFNCGLRDLARVGQLMLDEGRVAGQQVFPVAVVENIRRGGSKEAFEKAGYKTLPGGSYRSMWWIFHDEHGSFAARGVHGQTIYVDPTAKMVIARFASHPQAKNGYIDPTSLPAYRAVAQYLLKQQ